MYITIYISLYHIGEAHENEFRISSSSGCELVVECAVTDGGVTIWQGTIFDGCQNEYIILRHSQFNTSGIVMHVSCGTKGSVVGRSVSVAGGSFTSQLLVNITDNMIGKTIECANESGQIIGSEHINKPSGTQDCYFFVCISIIIKVIILWSTALLSSISINASTLRKTSELIIMWDLEYNDILNNNDTLNVTQLYTVNTSNCGMCPITTPFTSALCNLTVTSPLADNTCTVTVIAKVMECGITTNATSKQFSMNLNNGEIYL